jgi:deoxyadenosine/deoxycytidine kinase
VALYITLCGNIGVGKTTLAGIMAERWRWQLFQESVEDHPYLADYYAERTRWALASQLVFLERTFRQQLTITRGEVNSVQERSAAENYMVFARTLFEEAILSPREFGTLSDLYYLLEDAVRPADLLVYLRASEDTLLDRIALRGRSYESGGVDRDYLAALNRSYDRFYREYQIGPKLEINMNDFDIALLPSDSAEVLRQIAGATGYDPELVLF